MASYRIEWRRSAKSEFRKLPQQIRSRVLSAVAELIDNPFPTGARKLVGNNDLWRLRIGNYRVIYRVESEVLIIEIVRVRHRKDAYRH